MAFNFNWSPLIADSARAKELLTAALNKSPKPPIIVDDILVNELNLGASPPELEILEIGDLAEDRFRGIFKMSYAGDAYLTLKTKVQANPLNTYLSTKPSFTSPQPLAAASSLTIPLQITLSDIRLSGFVILVFCRQKGITLVFRNDPLESLKVSSTFDAIPFVRNYLQKEIEAQLRVLFMDDLPAIIHRLSLRHLVPGYREAEEHDEREKQARLASSPIDPLGSSTVSLEATLDEADIVNSTDPSKMHATFSQKNMLRLAALAESQRTLALFTCPIRDTVYRAWVGGVSDRRDSSTSVLGALHSHRASRIHSAVTSPTTGWSSAASETSESVWGVRPTLASQSSSASVYSMSRQRGGRYVPKKRRHRVVNLRRHSHDYSDTASISSETTGRHSAPDYGQWASASTSPIPERGRENDEVDTPPRPARSPKDRHVGLDRDDNLNSQMASPQRTHRQPNRDADPDTPRAVSSGISRVRPMNEGSQQEAPQRPPMMKRTLPSRGVFPITTQHEERPPLPRPLSIGSSLAEFNGSILEQAWIAKIQADHMQRVRWQQQPGHLDGHQHQQRNESARHDASEKASRSQTNQESLASRHNAAPEDPASMWDAHSDAHDLGPPPAYAV